MVPPLTLMSSTVKPVTASEKLKENETSPEAVPTVESLIVSVGAKSADTLDSISNCS